MLRQAVIIAALAASAVPALADPSCIAFQVPGAVSTQVMAINSAGDVAGFYATVQDFRSHGFVRLHDGTVQTFDGEGSQSTIEPYKINDRGDIAGRFYDGNRMLGFLREPDGTIRTFKVPGM